MPQTWSTSITVSVWKGSYFSSVQANQSAVISDCPITNETVRKTIGVAAIKGKLSVLVRTRYEKSKRHSSQQWK